MKLVPAFATVTVARLIGANHKPMTGPVCSGPERFSGPAWYAFHVPDMTATVVLWAEAEDADFIGLSEKDGGTLAYLSHEAFDFACVGRLYSAAEVERERKEREAVQ